VYSQSVKTTYQSLLLGLRSSGDITQLIVNDRCWSVCWHLVNLSEWPETAAYQFEIFKIPVRREAE
jgi:hypothetical protein